MGRSRNRTLILLDEGQAVPPDTARRLLALLARSGGEAVLVVAALAERRLPDAFAVRDPIGLDAPWSEVEVSQWLRRLSAAAGVCEEGLRAQVDVCAAVRSTRGNPRLLQAQIARQLSARRDELEALARELTAASPIAGLPASPASQRCRAPVHPRAFASRASAPLLSVARRRRRLRRALGLCLASLAAFFLVSTGSPATPPAPVAALLPTLAAFTGPEWVFAQLAAAALATRIHQIASRAAGGIAAFRAGAPDPGAAAPAPPAFTGAALPLPVLFHVNALPWAHVEVDGRAVGTTPLTLPLAPGPHHVLVRMADGRWIERKVDVSPEQDRVAFR